LALVWLLATTQRRRLSPQHLHLLQLLLLLLGVGRCPRCSLACRARWLLPRHLLWLGSLLLGSLHLHGLLPLLLAGHLLPCLMRGRLLLLLLLLL
jgi:hypothetical protein